MSKRFIFPQQNGDRKRAKLDVTVSDHNFPLSQNGPNKEPEKGNWGDDNDDEILLLASQACEDAYNDNSSLPDYSMCMQPGSTSTQLCDPGPSTSKAGFTFKKPSSIPSSVISTNLKDKYNRISSPLPGMTSKVLPKHESVDLNLIFNSYSKCSTDNIDRDNEKIYKGQDSEYVYRQLLQLQEENAKLKSENGKLLEKCVTKEGEASILRTQLKSCQVAVDNARMEKIKAQEKVQMEWTEKLAAANGQMHELRTQLDFKNLEIISVKERCRMLESNKVKLTQVTVPANDINSSHRNNISISDYAPPSRRVKVTSSAIQTEDKAHFLKLNKTYRSEHSKLTPILPIVLEPTTEQHSILEYNEKLQKQTDLSQNKCRIYSTFHRIPSTPTDRQSRRTKVAISSVHEDLTGLAAGSGDDRCFTHILSLIQSVLTEVHSQLELVSRKVTTSFLKQMDEKYVDATATLSVVEQRDLLGGKPLYKEEQAILARRMTAVLAVIIQNCSDVQLIKKYEVQCSQYLEIIHKICCLLDSTSCALLYSGLLLSITEVTDSLTNQTDYKNTIQILRSIISSRPMLFVSCQVLKILRKLSKEKDFIQKLCPGGTMGNLRLDYDQGVLLYKKDSCYIQILLKQVEVSLKCIERQRLTDQAVNTTRDLLALYSNVSEVIVGDQEKLTGCDCQLILLQVIVYALKICAVMLQNVRTDGNCPASTRLVATCRSGFQVLYQCVLRDVEVTSQLAHDEGHFVQFCETMRCFDHSEVYANMLSELSGTFQSSPEDAASSFSRQPWLKSFDAFSITD